VNSWAAAGFSPEKIVLASSLKGKVHDVALKHFAAQLSQLPNSEGNHAYKHKVGHSGSTRNVNHTGTIRNCSFLSQQDSSMDYKDICAALENGSMVPGDNAIVVAIGGFYAHNADLWISYESTESLVGKVCHAVDDVLAECQSVCCVYSTTSLKYTRFTYIR
jgi:hypothetical protein